MSIYPFCPLLHTALVLAFWSFAYHARWGLQDQSFAWKNGKLLEGRFRNGSFLHCWQPCHKFNRSSVCLGALCGHPPSNGTNWQCQATHEWRKKWSGWNRTTRTGGCGPGTNEHQMYLAKALHWCKNQESHPPSNSKAAGYMPHYITIK